jgi:hypothetical protein
MTLEVDQSIKVEASGDTVLALARLGTDNTFTVRIPADVKRACVAELRKRGYADKAIALRLFSAALFLLLESWLREDERIVIDIEYSGHEDEIRAMLLQWIRRRLPGYDPHNIAFANVGKSSLAHRKALEVKRKRARPDLELSAKRIIKLL